MVADDFWLIGADYPTKTLDYINDAINPEEGEVPDKVIYSNIHAAY